MTTTQTRPPAQAPERRSGELTLVELLRFAWRQLTSMRTALILLLLLALAAVPGSVIPQERVDAIKAGQWQDRHPSLTPVYQRLDLFNVYGSAWFAAIYLLLVVSLLGCIVPRTFHYVRALRAQPPPAPRNLTRLRDHAAYTTELTPEQVLAHGRRLFRSRRYRLRAAPVGGEDFVSAEKGFLREVGNLLFHLAVMVVLVGFAVGSLIGYKGGVILVTNQTFVNTPVNYDDFVPGTLFGASRLDPFDFTVHHFSVDWTSSGPRAGMPRGFNADLTYHASPGAPEQSYDLRVNHPLTIDHTEVFLIGQGYAPDVTIRDAAGRRVFSGPTVFLPLSADLFSTGVIKATGAQPQLGFQGYLYPNFLDLGGTPTNISGQADNPLLNLTAYSGDLGLGSGQPQSIYALDKTGLSTVQGTDAQPLRINLAVGQTETLPNGLGSITFNGVDQWQRIQISQTPGKRVALAGVVLALIGLLGSLFIRSRRVWVRAAPAPDGRGTRVEVAVLDRSGGADTGAVLSEVVAALQQAAPAASPPSTSSRMEKS